MSEDTDHDISQYVRSPESLADALQRLRRKGEFGLTRLSTTTSPAVHAQPAPGTSTVIDNELALPVAGVSDFKLSLNAPVGIETGISLAPPQGTATPAIKPAKLLELIEKPPKIDLKEAFDPGTSTLEEIDEKRRELQYRKDWLEALLAVTRDELAAFDEARDQRLMKDIGTEDTENDTDQH